MQIIDTLEKIDRRIKGCCLTVGNFDGVHLGHKKIIAAARRTAAGFGNCPVAAIVFDPHPAAILHPEKTPQVLTPLPLKKTLLESAGIDYLIILKDSYEFLTLSPADFVDDFLKDTIAPRAVIEGDDFHFGYGRSGSAKLLCQLGKQFGFDVVIIESEEIKLDGGPQKFQARLSVICFRRAMPPVPQRPWADHIGLWERLSKAGAKVPSLAFQPRILTRTSR